MSTLNGWQRLWVVTAVALLSPTVFMIIVFWPYSETDVVRDLNAPECNMWRELPSGYTAGEYPNVDALCYAIQSFLFMKAASVRSVKEYHRFVISERIKITAIWLLIWVIAIAFLYSIGFSFGWVWRGFRTPNYNSIQAWRCPPRNTKSYTTPILLPNAYLKRHAFNLMIGMTERQSTHLCEEPLSQGLRDKIPIRPSLDPKCWDD